jgi:hypothetical protein
VPCRLGRFAALATIGAFCGLWAAAFLPFAEVRAAYAQGAGPASLRQLTRDADAVVQARIAGPTTMEAGERAYAVVQAEVVGTFKGNVSQGTLVFANPGPVAPEFAAGDEVLLFLHNLERVAELVATPLQGRLRYATMSNGGEKILLTASTAPYLTDAVRRYVALEAIPDAESRSEALRELTLGLLKSGQPVLVTSVMREFKPGGDAAALTLADLPALVPLIESPRTPIGNRIALVAELERRGLIFGPARWVRLLRTSTGSDLVTVIHAVQEHPSAGVNAHLIPLLEDRDLAVATAAATALGVPGNVEAVRALTVSFGRNDAQLHTAALTSLGRIGTQTARQSLEMVAAKHPDPALRRRAEVEAVVLARRHGTTLAPSFGAGTDAALAAAPKLPGLAPAR